MYPNVADYRAAARRRLPRIAFDYLDGGAEDGRALQRNLDAYGRILLRPRVLRDLSSCSVHTEWFGRRVAAPMVVGPTGLNGLFWPHADEWLARGAAAAGLPFALSSASTSLLEDVRTAVPDGELWLQLYVQSERRIAEDMMRRAQEAGFSTLLLTVDTPVHGKRDHDMRNGFKLPLRMSPALLWDLVCNPHWSLQMARHGAPQLRNIARSLGEVPNLQSQSAALSRLMDLTLSWSDMGWLRRHWRGPVIVKGIQAVDDARLAVRHGVDGIVVSNHGGRQLESACASLDILPAVVDAVGNKLKVFVDGGVRRGADVVKAVALGACGVLLGRAPLYGLAARGGPGVREVLALLSDEMLITLRLLGCASLADLGMHTIASNDFSRGEHAPCAALDAITDNA